MLRPSLAALAAGLLCWAADAPAQTFSGLGPAAPFVLPGSTEAAGAAAEPVQTGSHLRRPPSLRRLAASAASLRVWGENGALTSPLYVTEAEARAGGTIQIGYLAAVSILPEASEIALSLNDAPLGSTAIDGTRGPRTVRIVVPPGALRPGFNALRLGFTQRHRVDCSVAATFELWTQIDPEATGFLPDADDALGLPDLPALRPSADGAMPIRLIQTGDRLSERTVARLIGAAQDLALAARIRQPSVAFAATPEAGDGIALAIGTVSELARAIDPALLATVSGPRLALLPETVSQRPTLVATGLGDADVAEALERLSALRTAQPRGTPAGLRAMDDAGGRPMAGGDTVSLAELGFADTRVTARSHRIAFDLALPHDMLPADYAKVVLDLDASYPPGLAPGAHIAVAINGATAASVPLARSGAEGPMHRAVFLPLALMRPGPNRIAITAELPRTADATCVVAPTPETERLTLFASTRLTIPPLARIGRQPELAETLAAAFPYAEGPRRPTLVVPAPDRDTMAAAATLAVRLGIAAGRPIPFAFAAGRSTVAGPSLVVATLRTLEAPALSAAGLDPQALGDAWSGPDVAPVSIAPQRDTAGRDAPATCRARPVGAASLSEADPVHHASAILAQATNGPAIDDVVTLVAAPGAAALRQAVDCLVAPQIWARPKGRIAYLSVSDGRVVSRSDTPRYVLTAESSPANLRLIAAGWLSLHAGLYGLFAVLLAGGLAGSTQVLVRHLGRRSS